MMQVELNNKARYETGLRDYQNFELYKRFGFDLNDNRYLDDKAKQVIRVIEKLYMTNRLDERVYCVDDAFIDYLTKTTTEPKPEEYKKTSLEALKEIKDKYKLDRLNIFDECRFELVERDIKALDIIKQMPKSIFHIGFTVDRKETKHYYIFCGDKKFKISEEAYKLLKETL